MPSSSTDPGSGAPLQPLPGSPRQAGVPCTLASPVAPPDGPPLDLVKAAQAGTLSAQSELIHAYQARLAGFVYAMLGRAAPVDDLCQDIFIKMLRGLPHLHSPELFEPWLFRMARNACIDHTRREKWRHIFTPFDPATDDMPIPVDAEKRDRAEALLALLQRLHPRDRSILIMAQQGLSLAEMARTCASTTTAIKTRLHRARERLRKLYEKRA
ncbi:MAG: ECF RNA polymerase sigma factor SigW [Verrucomicrobia bacterium ADurb.Bin122]|nr:MAG: ECF RNA polymerase sigma factor SigW [Verrucomicrobia bacterium ADurb.Bin122]